MQAAEVRAAVAAAKLEASTLCVDVSTVLTLLEQIQQSTPGWKLWRSAPVSIAIGVLRSVQAIVCGRPVG